MNSHKKFVITALLVALVVPMSAFAYDTEPKDGDKQDQEEKQEAREDSVGIYEDDHKVNDPFMLEGQILQTPDQNIPERRNTTYTPALAESEKVESEEESNSAMSFNFIYYIIDKFKLADPLD